MQTETTSKRLKERQSTPLTLTTSAESLNAMSPYTSYQAEGSKSSIHCGFKADRDLNAAMNLASVAASWAETLNVCERGEVHAER